MAKIQPMGILGCKWLISQWIHEFLIEIVFLYIHSEQCCGNIATTTIPIS